MTIEALTKGHGTANDFLLLLDETGSQEVSAEQVAALCDRRRGLGADGLIRAVRCAFADIPEAAAAADEGAEWFMDYRNADGSIAEMCGNGVRVFACFLEDRGLIDAAAGPVALGTRAGTKHVSRVSDPHGGSAPWYRVDMGRWSFPADTSTGFDALVTTAGIDVDRPGLSVDMGNPHTVVALAGRAELEGADLSRIPAVEPRPPHGTNVEYIVIDPASDADGDPSTGSLSMRVHERGVGETQSCGTGACAAALAARFWSGESDRTDWTVSLPGGHVRVEIAVDRVLLSGPAVLVAEMTLRQPCTAVTA